MGLEGDLTVHDPGAGVVRLPGQGQPSGGGKHGDITAGRADGLESGGVGVDTSSGAKHPEVVAVQVDGVSLGEVGLSSVSLDVRSSVQQKMIKTNLDDHHHPFIGGGQGPNVLGSRPRGVAICNSLHGGVVPLRYEGDCVHSPQNRGTKGEGSLLIVRGRNGADVDGQEGSKVGGALVAAGVHKSAVGS